ncbi:hypothetical protein POM88_018803 [Heracleum sosnowskyi]|uniref:Uncharacterized protein n=1 Tax=Heracleum sosnowskyi TaxID=360622 RepID=A0AAD8IV27_9APIA|nr:hypothetical protein POM88_018803 [Heracleum sosnowskyi]
MAVLTTEVIETAKGTQNVACEKESFRVLLNHLVGTLSKRYIQDVTSDIENSLVDLPLANTIVLRGISTQVNRLHNEMQTEESESSLSLNYKFLINQHRVSQTRHLTQIKFNWKEIAKAVGVPVDLSEKVELESFNKEKEEAENRKEGAGVFFSLCRLLHSLPSNSTSKGFSLCTGTKCDREALEASFSHGKKSDPQTRELLDDCSYRANHPLRQSMQEWKEHILCHKIRNCKSNLLGTDDSVLQALGQLKDLMRENSINKYWITIGGLTEIIISVLGETDNEGVLLLEGFSYVVARGVFVAGRFIKNGSVTSKARAAALIDDLSMHNSLLCPKFVRWQQMLCQQSNQRGARVLHESGAILLFKFIIVRHKEAVE